MGRSFCGSVFACILLWIYVALASNSRTDPQLLEQLRAIGERWADDEPLRVVKDPGLGCVVVRQGETPVLQYNYATVSPPDGYLPQVSAGNRKYAQPRSNYIHPLYGLDGYPLTKDWSSDHPHHRGLYWAWPEVQFGTQMGDLHALQTVFARPTGSLDVRSDREFVEIAAENEWRWNDQTPIVRETARIRVHRRTRDDRVIDLRFTFVALVDSVTIARRSTNAYGGLNLRLAPIEGLELCHHADPADASPRRAWQSAAGTWQGSSSAAVLTVFEHRDNPGYPGDYVQYPDLPWFQPTFPAGGTRHPLTRETPLVLQYRLWIHRGPPPTDAEYRTRWQAYQTPPRDEPQLEKDSDAS